MKTNITMKSTDRSLFGVIIRQETKTGFLNLSDLQSAYDCIRSAHGWSEKKYQDLLYQKENSERIFYILEEQGFVSSDFNEFTIQVEKMGIIKYLKSIGAYRTAGSSSTRTVWCNPYIWTLLAMELNPRLYAKVVTWMSDGLILNRIEAGDFYRGFSKSIKKFGPDYVRVAKALNYIVFNRHEAGIRNTATKEQLAQLTDLEKNMAFSVDMGDINSQEELIKRLKIIWNNKWNKKI